MNGIQTIARRAEEARNDLLWAEEEFDHMYPRGTQLRFQHGRNMRGPVACEVERCRLMPIIHNTRVTGIELEVLITNLKSGNQRWVPVSALMEP